MTGVQTCALPISVFRGTPERGVALLTAVAALIVTWAHHVAPPSLQYPLELAQYVLHALFIGFAVVVILGNVLKERLVTVDEVLGAVCGYLLAGAFWGNIYGLTELLMPGSFSMSERLAALLGDWYGRASVFNYFSLVTLTTLGYGDITPVRDPARTLAFLEAIFGQFYIAVLVAQLVGLRLARARPPDDTRQ